MFRDIDADCYLMVDGDDTYPAEAAKALCEPILNGTADMTVGDRLSNGTYAEENKRAFHGFGNNLVRAMIKWIYGYSFDDVMTGYRAMSRPFVKTFPVLSELSDRNRALDSRRRPPLAHQRCTHRVPRPSGRLRVQAQYRERRH